MIYFSKNPIEKLLTSNPLNKPNLQSSYEIN